MILFVKGNHIHVVQQNLLERDLSNLHQRQGKLNYITTPANTTSWEIPKAKRRLNIPGPVLSPFQAKVKRLWRPCCTFKL